MSQGSGRPENMPWVTPYLTVRDGATALGFYERAFGFKTRFAMPKSDGTIGHAEMSWDDGVVMLGPEGDCPARAPATSGTASPVQLYVYCDDVDALYDRAVAAGAQGDAPPTDMFWGDRMCRLTDPEGYTWCFATHVKKADWAEASAPA
jgi:uncharacterized glyoxalase superfamily protein PhnB